NGEETSGQDKRILAGQTVDGVTAGGVRDREGVLAGDIDDSNIVQAGQDAGAPVAGRIPIAPGWVDPPRRINDRQEGGRGGDNVSLAVVHPDPQIHFHSTPLGRSRNEGLDLVPRKGGAGAGGLAEVTFPVDVPGERRGGAGRKVERRGLQAQRLPL